MRRRDFITFLGIGAPFVSWPLAVRGQEAGRIYRLGFLTPTPREAPSVLVFFDELRLTGFVEGQNLTVIPGGFEATDDRVAERAAALINAGPDVIAAGPERPLQALQALTRTVPLVGITEDMVAEGLVSSLAHPGGNITGISLLSPELDGKRQDILIEMVPGARRIAAVADGRATSSTHIQMLEEGARSRGVELSVFSVKEPTEIASAIEAASASSCAAINFLASPMFSISGSRDHDIVIQGITAARLPAIFQWAEAAETDSVAAYGPRLTDMFHERARMVVKILRGAKPADIPVEQPERFELIINLKAAKAIGFHVPVSLVARADKVIE
jgi:putative tryptophan/tyrosine transport system substrate-binding protein